MYKRASAKDPRALDLCVGTKGPAPLLKTIRWRIAWEPQRVRGRPGELGELACLKVAAASGEPLWKTNRFLVCYSNPRAIAVASYWEHHIISCCRAPGEALGARMGPAIRL